MAVVTALIRGSFGYLGLVVVPKYPGRTRDSPCYPVRWKQLTDTIVGYICRVVRGLVHLGCQDT